MVALEYGLPGHRIHAPVCEAGADQCKVATIDEDRTLPEVDVEHGFRFVLQDAEAVHQVRQSAIPMAGLLLREVDLFVDRQRSSNVAFEGLQQPRKAGFGVAALEGATGRDCARVDHRVAGAAADGMQADGIEGFAGGLHVNLGQHGGDAVVLEC